MTTGCDGWNIFGRATASAFSPLSGSDMDDALEDGGGGDRGSGPVGQGPRGRSVFASPRNRSAPGQAAAKARRTRLLVSATRAAIFRSLSLRVANSAVARSRIFGMASRTVSKSQ